MIKQIMEQHLFMCSILAFGAFCLLLQAMMTIALKGYVKASANMKTTKKKLLLNLKNQFETIYGMEYQVRNIEAYVDKYLLKLRFMGASYAAWEKAPFLCAGLVTLLAGGEAFYEYITGAPARVLVEIVFAYGIVLVCFFVCFHIFAIKSRKQQIQIQLVDYLENYLANRLLRTREGSRETKLLDAQMEDAFMEGAARNKELQSVILEQERQKEPEIAYRPQKPDRAQPQEAATTDETEIELLEEFVQSFLA